eukprot:m.124022 g.124022  ORF g.124022 m.124022 type:complete len:56 (-) comp13766_c4_seq1:553-720(-)
MFGVSLGFVASFIIEERLRTQVTFIRLPCQCAHLLTYKCACISPTAQIALCFNPP